MKIKNIIENFFDKSNRNLELASVTTYHMDGNSVQGMISMLDTDNGLVYSCDVYFTNKSFRIDDVEVEDHGAYHEGDSEDSQIILNYIKNNYKKILSALKEENQ